MNSGDVPITLAGFKDYIAFLTTLEKCGLIYLVFILKFKSSAEIHGIYLNGLQQNFDFDSIARLSDWHY